MARNSYKRSPHIKRKLRAEHELTAGAAGSSTLNKIILPLADLRAIIGLKYKTPSLPSLLGTSEVPLMVRKEILEEGSL